MRISAKGRYGLSAMISLAQIYEKNKSTTLNSLSDNLGISKVYMEQIFSMLKRGGLVVSTKGSQGGYRLARLPKEITVYEIFSTLETTLFERTETTVLESAAEIEKAMQEMVFLPLDKVNENFLKGITLEIIAKETDKNKNNKNYMYYL